MPTLLNNLGKKIDTVSEQIGTLRQEMKQSFTHLQTTLSTSLDNV